MAKYNVSKKESKRLGIKRVKAGGGASMASDYGSLEKSLGGMESQVSKYADFASNVAKLPYELKDEFRKRRSPKLDAQIRESEQRMLGGYSEGLNKYKDIQDPFQRRELSEKYQGSLAETYGNLLDERDRRGGKFAEYIDKWAGLFGAEAARQQTLLDFTERKWQNYLTLADKKESKRRWEIELAEKRKTGGRGGRETQSKLYSAVKSMSNDVYSGKYNREEANKMLIKEYGKEAENMIYDYVPDEYEKSQAHWSKQEKGTSVAELKYKDTKAQEEEAGYVDRYYQSLRDLGYEDDDIIDEFRRRSWNKHLKRFDLVD